MDIYVGNLPYTVTDDDLRGLFEGFGNVASARVVTDKFSGRSRGFGFVEMPDQNEATNAIEQTNEKDFMGRPLRVNESRPRPRDRERSHSQRW
jgi:RNA recognition motif-containing protein